MKTTAIQVKGVHYKIRFPINAYSDYEEMCGKPVGEAILGNEALFVSDLRRLIYVGLFYGENEGLSVDLNFAGDLLEKSVFEHDSSNYIIKKLDDAVQSSSLPIIARSSDGEKK